MSEWEEFKRDLSEFLAYMCGKNSPLRFEGDDEDADKAAELLERLEEF